MATFHLFDQQTRGKKATVCNRHQTRNRKIESKQMKNARGIPGIMQVRCTPRLWPGPGQSLGVYLTYMISSMPRAFIICLLWILPGSVHLKRSQASSRWFTSHWKRCHTKQKHQNPSKSTNMARFGLRIRVFESHSHFLLIGNPPRPTKCHQNTLN